MPEEKTTSLAQKLLQVGKNLGFLEFDARNSGMGYGYASAAGVIRKLNVALSEVGVTVSTRESLVAREPMESGAVRSVVQVTLLFRDAETGDEIATQGLGEGQDKGDKATMKASTAAYKYAIAHALVLGWGAEDPEADATTDEPAKAAPAPAKASKGGKAKTKADPKEVFEGLMARIKVEGPTKIIRAEIIGNKDILVGAGLYETLTNAYKAADAAGKEAN